MQNNMNVLSCTTCYAYLIEILLYNIIVVILYVFFIRNKDLNLKKKLNEMKVGNI